jgi:hypothetical protein
VKRKPVIPRKQAHLDTQSILDYYLAETDQKAALGFVDALEKAYAHLSRHPASGATRLAMNCFRYTLGLTPAIREKPLVISIGKIAERSIKSLLFMLSSYDNIVT